MSKENAIEFFKLLKENPNLLKEAESSYAALSKIAKEKGFECSAKEIEEIMGEMMSPLNSGELDDSDLENVAGGWFWNDIKDSISKVKNWFCGVKEQAVKVHEVANQVGETLNEIEKWSKGRRGRK